MRSILRARLTNAVRLGDGSSTTAPVGSAGMEKGYDAPLTVVRGEAPRQCGTL